MNTIYIQEKRLIAGYKYLRIKFILYSKLLIRELSREFSRDTVQGCICSGFLLSRAEHNIYALLCLLRAHEQKIFHDTLPYRHFFEKNFLKFFLDFMQPN